MHRNIAIYLQDLRNIEAMFDAFDLKKVALDTDAVEDTLADWEQFIDVLRESGEAKLADTVYEKLEEIEERLAHYELEQIKAEEQAVVDDASERLSQSAVDNLLSHTMKMKQQAPDIAAVHKANFRLRNRNKDFLQRLKRLLDES